MPVPRNRLTSSLLVTAVVLGATSLGGCATNRYVDEQIALMNTRIDAVDARAQDGVRRADAANAAAQAAASAAQAANAAAQAASRSAQTAAADATRANQRLDQLTTRVDTIDQRTTVTARTPRN